MNGYIRIVIHSTVNELIICTQNGIIIATLTELYADKFIINGKCHLLRLISPKFAFSYLCNQFFGYFKISCFLAITDGYNGYVLLQAVVFLVHWIIPQLCVMVHYLHQSIHRYLCRFHTKQHFIFHHGQLFVCYVCKSVIYADILIFPLHKRYMLYDVSLVSCRHKVFHFALFIKRIETIHVHGSVFDTCAMKMMFKSSLHKVLYFLRGHIPVKPNLIHQLITQNLQIVHETIALLRFTTMGKIKAQYIFIIPCMDNIKFNTMHIETEGSPCLILRITKLCILLTV